MTDSTPEQDQILGELLVAMMPHFDVRPEQDADGKFTNRLIVTRPTGIWTVTIEPKVLLND